MSSLPAPASRIDRIDPGAAGPAPPADAAVRLRIALVVEAMDTGVAQLVSLLAAGLAGRGHAVVVFHSLRRLDHAALRRLQDDPLITCVGVDMRRRVGPSDLTAGLELRRALRRHGPFDIIHGHSTKAGALVRLGAIGLPGLRLYTPHAFFTLSPGLGGLTRVACRLAERLLARLGQAVVCSSSIERDHAIGIGIPSTMLTVIPNGIEPPSLAPPDRAALGVTDDRVVILGFVGRFEDQKAPDVLLQAVAQVLKIEPAVMLVMIGHGGLEERLRLMADELGIADRVRWLGRQRSVAYLASFDILAQPSRYEGFSLMPLEAMHARLPIICTPVGGVAETVVDGETGLVVPVDDRDALGAALLALVRDPARRRAMGEAAHARAPLFLDDRMVALNERLYRDLLAGRPASDSGWSMVAAPSEAAGLDRVMP